MVDFNIAPQVLNMLRENSETENNVGSTTKHTFKERVSQFEAAIKMDIIDFQTIQKLAFSGIPDSPGLRSIFWKLLLSYLPQERNQWQEILHRNRNVYKDWIVELITDPRKNMIQDDHPLNTSQSSQWHAFFKEKELLEEIDKDVKRTLPGLHFFNNDKKVGDTLHYEALKRILFIYAKLNPGIRYVQGMNEILGPLYYIFASDPVRDFQENAEADTFFCFTNLMSEIRDNFCKTLDKSSIGITGLISKLNSLLKIKDLELWQDFENKSLNPQFYSFRWLTLLLSQEFDLPDVLRLWDSLFADPVRFEYLLYVCCAMLICLRETLLDGSFAENLKLLQSYPLQDIHTILGQAEQLQNEEYQSPPPRPPKIIQPTREAAQSISLLNRFSIAQQRFPIINNINNKKVEVQENIEEYNESENESKKEEEEKIILTPPTTIDLPKVLQQSFEEEKQEEEENLKEKSHPLA